MWPHPIWFIWMQENEQNLLGKKERRRAWFPFGKMEIVSYISTKKRLKSDKISGQRLDDKIYC